MRNEKVKILHITFNLCIGGTQQVIRQIVENSDSLRFEHQILCIDGSLGAIGESLIEAGLHVTVYEKQPGVDYQLITFIKSYIKEHAVDMLHCHQYTPYFYGVLGGFLTAAKIIFTEHGRFYPDRHNFKRRLINPLLSFFTDEITAISVATANALTKYEYLNAAKISVIYNGIKDLKDSHESRGALLNDLKLSNQCRYVGTVSRLVPIKNQKMMIKAFSILKKEVSNIKLIIIGDGEIKADLSAYVNQLGLENDVKFTGFINDPQRYIKLFEVFLLSSFSEGASMTLLEAMSLSVPCLVTNVGGNPEIITDKDNGRIVPSDDSKSFAIVLKEMLADENTMGCYGQSARKQYLNKFSVCRMISSYESLYLNCNK